MMGDTPDNSYSSSSSESPGGVNSYNRILVPRKSSKSNTYQFKSTSSSYYNYSRSSESSSSPGGQVSSSSKLSGVKKVKKQDEMKVKHPCEMCGKKVLNIVGHVQRMHGGHILTDTVTCGQCDETILQSNLGKHVLAFHMEEESVSPPLVSDEDSNPDLPVNMLKPVGEVSESASGDKKKQTVLPRLSRMFNRDIVVDFNQNTVEKVDTVLATVDEKLTNESSFNDVVKTRETIQFWIKTKDRNLEGEQVRSLKIKMARFRTIGRAKRSYSDKLGLDKNMLKKLQFMLKGRMLEDEEKVGMLDNKTIIAAGLLFSA